MADENSIGTSRLLQGVGTNNLQSAADSVTNKFDQIAQAATSVISAFQTTGRSGNNSGNTNHSFFTASWNNNSNNGRYGSNGGGGTFTGNSFNSIYSRGGPNNGGPPNGNGGGGRFSASRGNRVASTFGAAAGVASALNSYANKNMASMMQMNYFGTSSAFAGGGTAGINTAQRLAFSNNYAALSVNDAAAAGYTNAYTFGNPVFNGVANPAFVTGQAQANAFGYINPTMGAQAAANAAQQTYSPRSFYAAQGLGIASPILPGGVKNSMGNIASSIYSRVFGSQKITPQGFNASIMQGGSLNSSLQYIGSMMGWSQATQQEYQNYIQGMVIAQNKGMSQSTYSNLLQQAAAGNKNAQGQLKNIGVGNSAFEAQRNLTSTHMTRSEDVNETMATAFTNTTNVVNQFSSALTALMKNTGLDKLLGIGAGTVNPISNALGGFSGAFGAFGGIMSASRLFGGGGGILGRLGMGAAGAGEAGALGVGGAGVLGALGIGGAIIGAGLGANFLAHRAASKWQANFQSTPQFQIAQLTQIPGINNQYGVALPSSWSKDPTSLQNYLQAKAQAMSTYGSDWPSQAANWETQYLSSYSSGRSGGGSSSVVGNSIGNGAANMGASAASVISAAESQLGVKYMWGGEIPNKGMDCSGLTQWAYSQAGVKIPRVAADQQRAAKGIPTNATQPGDLLFIGNPAHHVVMSIGGGKIIEAPYSGATVRERSLNPSEFTSAGRFLGNIGNINSLLNGNSASTSTLNDLRGMSGGDIGSFIGGTSELAAITAALAGGLGSGTVSAMGSSSSTGTSGTSVSNGNGNNSISSLQSYAKQLLASYGWAGEWDSFNSIVMAESGWNYKARNAQSGAYGIPQSLPGSKMFSSGSDWQTNGDTQLRWMMSYIKGRYGDPNAAWSFHQKNNYYDQGAWSISKDQNATVHQGEMIIPAQQAETIRQTLVNSTFNPNVKNNSSGSSIQFGNIYVQMPVGYSGTSQEATALTKSFIDAIESSTRIKNLQIGQ